MLGNIDHDPSWQRTYYCPLCKSTIKHDCLYQEKLVTKISSYCVEKEKDAYIKLTMKWWE